MKKTIDFRLTEGRSGASCIISSGNKGELSIYDPKVKARRAIRHCPNQRSIFRDEQDDYAIVQPVVFEFGVLKVPEDQPLTIEFLRKHPSNAANGGIWFEEIDEEKTAKEDIIEEELQIDLKYLVRKTAKEKDGLHKMAAVVSVIKGSIDEAARMGIEQLKQELYWAIEDDSSYFTDDNGNITLFDDDLIDRKYITLRAIKDGVLRKSTNNRSIVWGKDKSHIVTAPHGTKLEEFFAEFLSTDEGMLVAEEIAKRS